MPEKELYYNYDWTTFPDSAFPRIIREFLDNGADHFVFTSELLQRALDDPDYINFLGRCMLLPVVKWH